MSGTGQQMAEDDDDDHQVVTNTTVEKKNHIRFTGQAKCYCVFPSGISVAVHNIM